MSASYPEFSGPELCKLQAHEVIRLLKRREVSPSEVLDVALARTDAVDPVINSTPIRCDDRARAAVVALDPELPSHLAGLPISIKDLTDVAGLRTTFGTPVLAENVAATSDYLVERLEKNGGIIAGKTNTPEMGAGGNTFNEVFGPTLNPWDIRLNAGGSSGGAAAALATGAIWLSHGSDSAGSLRTPSAFCGVVGLRPSPGLIASGPRKAAYLTEGVEGPMARTVQDVALFLDAMVGFDPRVPLSYPAPADSYQDAVLRADGNIRVAFSPDLNGLCSVDTEVAEHLVKALHIAEGAGAIVEQVAVNLPNLVRTYETFRALSWMVLKQSLPATVTDRFKPELKKNIEFGAALTGDDIVAANIDRTRIYTNMTKIFSDFDVLACPVVGCMPHPQSEEWVAEIGGQTLNSYLDWLRFSYLSTITGLPSMSVPVGLGPRNLPVGIQLIGPPRGEARLLAAARAFEVALNGPLLPIDPVMSN